MSALSYFKVFPAAGGLCLALLSAPAQAKPPTPFYKFTPGETNAWSVEITVQGENGEEVTSGNVIMTTTAVTAGVATVDWHGSLRTENRPPFQAGPGLYAGRPMRGLNGYGGVSELALDDHGRVLRNSGDYALPVPLGELVQFIFTPLPPQLVAGQELKDEVQVLDAPQLLGPIQSFATSSFNSPGYSPGYYTGRDPRSAPAMLTLARSVTWQVLSNSPGRLTLEKHTRLHSLLLTGSEPRLQAGADARLEFDLTNGWFQIIEGTAELTSVTENTSRKSKIKYTCRHLTGAAEAGALAPPAPSARTARPVLSAEDVRQLITDLKSDDANNRRLALGRLQGGASVPAPPAELLSLLVTETADPDQFTRMVAMNFLAEHATLEQVPTLVKCLKDGDLGVRRNAVKALTHLQDERAIQPLADYVARGDTFDQEAASALINQGPAAEKAVLALLDEHAIETRRQACLILRQIGTRASLEPLQKQMTDPDQSLSQAAVDAVRAINERQ